MGGSVVVKACPRLLEDKYKVGGVVVLDVVEGNHSLLLCTQLIIILRHRVCNRSTSSHAFPAERSTGWFRQHRRSNWMAVSYILAIILLLRVNPDNSHKSVTTNAIRNSTSARVSVPSIVTQSDSGSPLIPPVIWRTPLRSTAPYWSSSASLIYPLCHRELTCDID